MPYRIEQRLRQLHRQSINYLLNRRTYDMRDTLVVTGCPRSGTTWLGELLLTIEGTSMLFEPLNLGQVPEAKEAGFDWRTHVTNGTETKEMKQFLTTVFEGRLLTPWTARYIDIGQAWKTSRWIVKFVRANRMISWIAAQFPVRAPVMMIRHPCAVIASQMAMTAWSNPERPVEAKFLQKYPEFNKTIESLNTAEEYLAACWAIDNYVPLKESSRTGWHLLCYEQLVLDSERLMRQLLDDWGIAMPSQMLRQIKVPSATSNGKFSNQSDRDRLGSWKRRLTAEQIRRILDVTSAFGLDFYSDDPEPDYAQLAN